MGILVKELQPGTMLLGYRTLGLLAQGGMAEVYLARKPGQEAVVLKRIRPNLLEDPSFVRMFTDEAMLAQQLSHPNVVKVLEIGKDKENYALCMEFLDGRNLLRVARACYQRKAYVPYELMGRIVADSLDGLHHAHTLRDKNGKPVNMVHRDMSPENIVITYKGVVKVVDFGIAKAANMEGRTQAGVIKGKLGYVAPEAVAGETLDGRADVFAMGVTLYELMTYTVPFSGANEVEILTNITMKEAQPPKALNPSVPDQLEDICMKALEKNRNRRWSSALEMKTALEAFIKTTGKGTTTAHLAAFMEALFPVATDKDRVRVAQMLAFEDPDAPAAPAAPAPTAKTGRQPALDAGKSGEQRAAAFEDSTTKKSGGPAWSKMMQIEAMMDQGAMPAPTGSSIPPTNLESAPPPKKPAAKGKPQPPPPAVEMPTDATELPTDVQRALQQASLDDGPVFGDEDPPTGNTAAVEDDDIQAALAAADAEPPHDMDHLQQLSGDDLMPLNESGLMSLPPPPPPPAPARKAMPDAPPRPPPVPKGKGSLAQPPPDLASLMDDAPAPPPVPRGRPSAPPLPAKSKTNMSQLDLEPLAAQDPVPLSVPARSKPVLPPPPANEPDPYAAADLPAFAFEEPPPPAAPPPPALYEDPEPAPVAIPQQAPAPAVRRKRRMSPVKAAGLGLMAAAIVCMGVVFALVATGVITPPRRQQQQQESPAP